MEPVFGGRNAGLEIVDGAFAAVELVFGAATRALRSSMARSRSSSVARSCSRPLHAFWDLEGLAELLIGSGRRAP